MEEQIFVNGGIIIIQIMLLNNAQFHQKEELYLILIVSMEQQKTVRL